MDNKHILSGIRWTIVTSVLRRVLTLALFYFVARWLSKDDLGNFRTYSLILLFISIVSTLSLDFQYIIEQKRKHTNLIALWQISVLASLICFVILSLGSGLIGLLYKSEILSRFFLYTSVFVVIEILRRAVRSVATKQLQFKELALAETYNVIFYSIVSIVALYFYKSVWVFLIIFYLGNAVELIYLWLLNRKLNAKALRYVLSKAHILCLSIRKYKGFVTQATVVSTINQIAGNAPILILGLWVNPVYLGLYYFASQLVGIPVNMLTAAINQVFFPVFSETKNSEIVTMTDRFIRLVGNLGLPLLMLMSVVLMHLVEWLFGVKWVEAIPLLPMMFILFGSSLFVNPIGGIPFVKRKPGWELVWNVVAFVVKVGAMLIGLKTSFMMAILAYAIASAVMNVAFYLMAMTMVEVSLYKSLQKLCVCIVPTAVFALLNIAIFKLQDWMALSLSACGCILLIVFINILEKGRLKADIRQLMSI